MANSSLADIEELTLCSCCKRPFDDAERVPKLLACKHHFCLSCARGVLGGGGSGTVHCMHCWTASGRAELLPTHGAVLALARRLAAPAAHRAHDAGAQLAREARELRADLARLAARQRDMLLRALDAATALKLRLEAELAAPVPEPAPPEPASLPAAAAERDRLRARHAQALLQCRLDDIVRSATTPIDLETIGRSLTGSVAVEAAGVRHDPLVLLGNYCAAQVWVRAEAAREADGSPLTSTSTSDGSPLLRAPSPYPLYYFELEVEGAGWGRVVVEVRDDVAPRMARNFAVLASGALGVGYRGCAVFQCWENESVITGDFELNNGRGGRSVYEESYFMPDDTRMAAVRGSVGMRRSQKRHDSQGLVGSQFRIVLREMRGFTAIFGMVVEGLELVDRLSRTGDSAGKPHSTILISNCGKLN